MLALLVKLIKTLYAPLFGFNESGSGCLILLIPVKVKGNKTLSKHRRKVS